MPPPCQYHDPVAYIHRIATTYHAEVRVQVRSPVGLIIDCMLVYTEDSGRFCPPEQYECEDFSRQMDA